MQKVKDTTSAGVLLGSGKLATELDRLDLIDEYRFKKGEKPAISVPVQLDAVKNRYCIR